MLWRFVEYLVRNWGNFDELEGGGVVSPSFFLGLLQKSVVVGKRQVLLLSNIEAVALLYNFLGQEAVTLHKIICDSNAG